MKVLDSKVVDVKGVSVCVCVCGEDERGSMGRDRIVSCVGWATQNASPHNTKTFPRRARPRGGRGGGHVANWRFTEQTNNQHNHFVKQKKIFSKGHTTRQPGDRRRPSSRQRDSKPCQTLAQPRTSTHTHAHVCSGTRHPRTLSVMTTCVRHTAVCLSVSVSISQSLSLL